MIVLFENTSGYLLIKKLKKNKRKILDLVSFYEYQTKKESISSNKKLIKGKAPRNLKKFLRNNLNSGDVLIVNDEKLKNHLKSKFFSNLIKIKKKNLIFREIRKHRGNFFKNKNLDQEKFKTLSLTHSIFCDKLKINGTKIDNMIIQAIRILDEIEKEINNYSMRLKNWYSWHFPELTNLINDNLLFAKIISKFEKRENLSFIDLSDLISNDLENQIKEAAKISFGIDLYNDDLLSILSLCGQIIAFSDLKIVLQKYIKNRMYSIAPNLTAIIGEKIGARLIAQSGSLANLSKHPASTIQILGAEKTLFKSFKNKKCPPKYGLIFHASLINSTSIKIRGKISRITSGKIAISARIDALGEVKYGGAIGLQNKKKIENRIRQLESFNQKKKN
jgi:nucleolar protein 58